MIHSKVAKVTFSLLALWFVISLSLSALHVFQNNQATIGISVAIAATVPLVFFAAWFAASKRFREFTESIDPRYLTYSQSWRILGFVFVILQGYGILPSLFASPAGYGDMFIGLTAPFIALKFARDGRRGSFIFWQFLGIADLVSAVGLGTTARLLSPQAPSMLPMTILPLSLIPIFLVPLFLIFHVISIRNARRWSTQPPLRTADASQPIRLPA
jgi:hypothetical protein